MNTNKPIIAIAGNARSGKDTLGKNIKEILSSHGIKSTIYSFADELKKETNDFLINTIGISSFTNNDEEKKIIRPFLVFWGTEVRRKLIPNIWIDKISHQFLEDEVSIITDLRFENELEFIINSGGSILYLTRISEDGSIIPAANSYEEYNNKIISDKADSNFTWLSSEDQNLLKSLSNEALETILTIERFEKWKAISL